MPDAMLSHTEPMPAPSLNQGLASYLVNKGILSRADLEGALRVLGDDSDGQPLADTLRRLNMVSEPVMAEAIADMLKRPLAQSRHYPLQAIAADKLPPRFLHEYCIIPLKETRGQILLAMQNPADDYPAKAVELALGRRVRRCTGVPSEIQRAIERLYEQKQADDVDAAASGKNELCAEDVEQLRDMASEAPVIRLVSQMFQYALDQRASDIHIEPGETSLKIRYRVDGVLREYDPQPADIAAAVISRVKIMAKLDIAERRLPQDGRIKLRMQGHDLDIRVSTMPTIHGESVVMRMLHRESISLQFETLGFGQESCERLQSILQQPHGMLIVTGPTGSGKTTTLYTAIGTVNTDEKKVITVEDPVEYQLAGINQIQVKPDIGLTFASTLRSIVRQDPDVILVGEMRDLETAQICVQSALTGHLVLSTLHTNDAASSVTRLLEMGVEDYLLISTLSAVIGQRLVRKLCAHCRQAYRPLPEVIEELGLASLNVAGEAIQLYRAKGCEACDGSGYRGRLAIFELLQMNDEIRKLVVQRAGSSEIQQAAVRTGMRTIYQDGCRKAMQGLTTIEEVVRVTREA
ncbi:type II secretion system ATPase GspE [Pseudomaricurvus hydrocarbonicus]